MPAGRVFTSPRRIFNILFVVVLCIVTFGSVKGQGHSHLTDENGGVIGKSGPVMGPKSLTDSSYDNDKEVPVNVVSSAADMPQASASNFNGNDGKTIEERLLAKSAGARGYSQDKDELKNPHPHISMPQLPFCKPSKSTVGSNNAPKSSEETKKVGSVPEKDEYGEDNTINDEDIEIIGNTVDQLETERKFLVATLDGKVTLLNKTGHQLWTVKTGPLFSSTISSLQVF